MLLPTWSPVHIKILSAAGVLLFQTWNPAVSCRDIQDYHLKTVTQRYLIYHILPVHLPQNLHGWQPHESAFRFWQNSDSGAVPLTENRNRSVSLVPVLIPEGPPDKP